MLFSAVLGYSLFLKLADMARHTLEILLQLSDLRVCFQQVLGVEVAIGADLLIQVKLELKFGLRLQVLLLKLGDQVVLQLDLLETLVVPSVGCGRLVGIVFFVLLELDVLGLQFLHGKRVRLLLKADLRQLLLVHLNLVLRLALLLLLSDQVTVEKLALVDLSIDVLLLVLDFLLHLLLLSDMNFKVAVNLLFADVEVFLAGFGHSLFLGYSVHLLLQFSQFFLSGLQIIILSILIGLLLEVLGLLTLAVLLKFAIGRLIRLLHALTFAIILLHFIQFISLVAQLFLSLKQRGLKFNLGILVLFDGLRLVVLLLLKLLS